MSYASMGEKWGAAAGAVVGTGLSILAGFNNLKQLAYGIMGFDTSAIFLHMNPVMIFADHLIGPILVIGAAVAAMYLLLFIMKKGKGGRLAAGLSFASILRALFVSMSLDLGPLFTGMGFFNTGIGWLPFPQIILGIVTCAAIGAVIGRLGGEAFDRMKRRRPLPAPAPAA